MKKLLVGLLFLLAPAAAWAQSLTAERIYLGTTGCAMRTGSGAPTGGAGCDFYLDTATGHVWVNHGGTWVDASTRTPTFQTVTATTSVTTPTLTAAANLTIAPTGDLLLAPAGRDVMPGQNYTVNLGALEDKYLTLHAAELWVETLVAQQTMTTIGGRVLVAPTNILAADLPAAATTLTVKYNNFLNGDIVYMESNGRVEFMGVTSSAGGSAGAYTYTITRNLDGSGANAWNAGDALLDTGTTGKGFIDLYSLSGVLSGAGPTIVGNVRTGGAFNDIAPRFAVGNLNGLYGHSGDQYGFAAGNPLGAYVYLDDNNGLVMGGPTGVKVQLTPAGNASFAGTVTAAAGNIGGWTIDANQLSKLTGGLYSGMHAGPSSNVRFYAGATGAGGFESAPFRVYADGSVVMSSAVITAPNAGSGGAALNADADTRDIGLWANCAGACASVNLSDGRVGAYSLRSLTGVGAAPIENRRIPFDPNKTYRFHVWARAGGGANGNLYVGLSAFDSAGSECDATGCPTGGGRYAYCAGPVAPASLATWTEYVCSYGAGSGYPIPAAIRSLSVQALLNIGGSAGWMEIQDVRLEEMAPSTLIKDGAITTNKIVAHSITVNELNATGYGDNLIKNGAFEPSVGETTGGGPTSSALAGWARATDANTAEPLVSSCCGVLGPGTLLLNASAGTFNAAAYQAVPIEATSGGSVGVKYRLSARIYQGAAVASLYVIAVEYNGTTSGVRRVIRSPGAAYPDVSSTSETQLAACGVLPAGWNTIEYVYTPPSDTRFVSLYVFNASGVCGGTYTAMHVDDVEMQKQIGTGHISANSITANLIQAGAITAGKLAADSVTSANIVAGTITASDIAAGTITGGNIAADSITGAHIVAGTITASDIATGTITADRLNVTSLSAISANLGSITAGNISAVAISGGTIDGTTIRGVTITASSTITGGSITSGTSITGATIDGSTITAGSGSVVLNASGITVGNGDSNGNARIKLGPSELWGGSFGLSTAGGMNAGALLVNGTSHLVGGVTADAGVNVGGTVTAGQLTLNQGQGVYFQSSGGAGPTLTWQASTSPPSGSGSNMGYNSGCACLVFISSSVRFKENLRPWTAADPLAILSLPLYRYDFRNVPTGDHVVIPSKDHIGFTVEDLLKIAPDAVTHDAQGRPESFYSDTLDTYLLAALKAVNARVTRTEDLEARIRELETQVAALLARKGGHP